MFWLDLALEHDTDPDALDLLNMDTLARLMVVWWVAIVFIELWNKVT